jgi:hypothetical protein
MNSHINVLCSILRKQTTLIVLCLSRIRTLSCVVFPCRFVYAAGYKQDTIQAMAFFCFFRYVFVQ